LDATGCIGHPAFPALSCFRAEDSRTTRAYHAAKMLAHLEPSLPATNAKRLRKGAKATKQSTLSLRRKMDCFACARNDDPERNATCCDTTHYADLLGHSTPLILPAGQISAIPVHPLSQKYSCFLLTQITSLLTSFRPERGTYRDRHGRWAGNAVDATASGTRECADE
jgi:hypothetical protein